MAAAAEARGGDFPVGMKVLVVDDDPTCLLVLKRMLDECKYHVTTCPQATRALTMLRENRRGFDVIISDVHMPDMDGFRLLELVGLEMDLPVIMMSADSSTNTVMKGIKHGACDYLIKPVRMEELKNIWQHVVRKKFSENKDHEHSGSIDDTDRNKAINNDNEYASSANDVGDGNWKSQKKKRDKEDDEGDENGDPSSTSKKPRVVWSVELHQQFVNAVNHLGIDKAVPKKILELMNVPGLTRENVASHLQKFRLYLKRIAQHHAGIPHPFVPSASNAKVTPLGGLELQALAASGQIPPQALAALQLQDELLGRPTSSLALSGRDQSSLRLAAIKGNKPHGEREIAFGQPIYKSQNNAYGCRLTYDDPTPLPLLSKFEQGEREYYEKQFATLRSFEEVDSLEESNVINEEDDLREQNQSEFAMKISNYANIILLALKIYATIKSGSIAIAASTLDSLLDLMAGGILWFTHLSMKSINVYKYPIGKLRVQPVGIIIFAAVMATLGFQVFIQAVEKLIVNETPDKLNPVQLLWLYSIMIFATVVKLALWLFCRTSGNKIVRAYAKDHYFDVITNVVGLAAAVLGDKFYWWIDPIGAIALAVYTITNWSGTVWENAVSLVGESAPPEMLQKLTYLAIRHHPQIKRVDTVRAYTFGVLYFVEVDIELPEDLPLKEAHAIGESLQIKIEELPEVERAFVHLDFECDHKPEHSILSKLPSSAP